MSEAEPLDMRYQAEPGNEKTGFLHLILVKVNYRKNPVFWIRIKSLLVLVSNSDIDIENR